MQIGDILSIYRWGFDLEAIVFRKTLDEVFALYLCPWGNWMKTPVNTVGAVILKKGNPMGTEVLDQAKQSIDLIKSFIQRAKKAGPKNRSEILTQAKAYCSVCKINSVGRIDTLIARLEEWVEQEESQGDLFDEESSSGVTTHEPIEIDDDELSEEMGQANKFDIDFWSDKLIPQNVTEENHEHIIKLVMSEYDTEDEAEAEMSANQRVCFTKAKQWRKTIKERLKKRKQRAKKAEENGEPKKKRGRPRKTKAEAAKIEEKVEDKEPDNKEEPKPKPKAKAKPKAKPEKQKVERPQNLESHKEFDEVYDYHVGVKLAGQEVEVRFCNSEEWAKNVAWEFLSQGAAVQVKKVRRETILFDLLA